MSWKDTVYVSGPVLWHVGRGPECGREGARDWGA